MFNPFIIFPYLPSFQHYLLGYLCVIIIYVIYLGIYSLTNNLSYFPPAHKLPPNSCHFITISYYYYYHILELDSTYKGKHVMVFFWTSLISLKLTIFSFILFSANGKILFLFMTENYSIEHVYHIFFCSSISWWASMKIPQLGYFI
jgi:hypothetical protein